MKLTNSDQIASIPLGQIAVGDRIRPLDVAAVDVIVASAQDLGHITTPIHVRRIKGGFELIDGRHRLAAAERLGLEAIEARIWECRKEEARLMEGDANLSIAHLTPLDIAVNLAARKRAYEDLFPDTRAGVAGGLARQGQQSKNLSFADFMATVLGLGRRRVEQMVACGASLSQDDVVALRAAPKRLAFNDLAEIAKIGVPEERAYVVKSLAEGTAKNSKSARRAMVGPAPEPKDPVEVEYRKIATAFANASKAGQRRFVATHAETIKRLLNEAE